MKIKLDEHIYSFFFNIKTGYRYLKIIYAIPNPLFLHNLISRILHKHYILKLWVPKLATFEENWILGNHAISIKLLLQETGPILRNFYINKFLN